MQIKFTRRFVKALAKCSPRVQQAFYRRLSLFLDDKFNPILNNHKLKGRLNNYRSLNITGDVRAIFQEDRNREIAVFYYIGTHSELYKK